MSDPQALIQLLIAPATALLAVMAVWRRGQRDREEDRGKLDTIQQELLRVTGTLCGHYEGQRGVLGDIGELTADIKRVHDRADAVGKNNHRLGNLVLDVQERVHHVECHLVEATREAQRPFVALAPRRREDD